MYVKIINSYRYVVAVCDKELIGKVFEEGNIELNVKESFYKGKEVSEEELIEIIRKMAAEDATFNIVGKKSVNTALKAGLIEEEGIRTIQGIPVALVLI